MTINLLDLAKQVEETYRDVECSFGKVRVYHVPDVVLLSIVLDRPEPEQPMVSMRTATGAQDRPVKRGDKGYEEWLQDKSDYEADLFRMRNASATVMALRDIEYPDTSIPPTPSAVTVYNGNWPEDEILRKKLWLDFTVLAKRTDQSAILTALSEMNGEVDVTEDMVESVKKNSE